jgi:hypothetical protein
MAPTNTVPATSAIPYAGEGLDLFEGQLVQTQILHEYYEDFHPTIGINSASGGQMGQIDIIVPKSPDYVDMSQLLLVAEVKLLKKDGSSITDKDPIGPINNVLDSAFFDINVQFNGKSLVLSRHDYPYLSYVAKLLNYEKTVKEDLLEPFGWIDDTSGKFNALFNPAHTTENAGLARRRQMLVDNPDGLSLMSYLLVPLSNQTKFLPGGVELKFTFSRSTDNFMLMGKSDGYAFKVSDMHLNVRKVVPTPDVIHAHQLLLTSKDKPITFYYKHTVTKTGYIPLGGSEATKEFKENRLPTQCLVAFMPESCSMGSLSENPFHFNHQNIQHACCYHNGVSFPFKPYDLNIARKKYARAYLDFQRQVESSPLHNRSNGIGPQKYLDNCFFLAFDFSAGDEKQQVFSKPKTGSLKCELKLNKPVTQALSVMFFCTYDCSVSMDKNGDFNFDSPL